MNPSSSSSAEPAPRVTYKVSTRGLSADLTTVGADESSRDLGPLELAPLAELLSRLARLDPAQVGDHDPHLIITGARGRFAVRPGRGKLVLRDAAAPHQSYLELNAADVPAYLDGHDPVAVPSTQESASVVAELPPSQTRHPAFGWAAFALAAALVAGSAFWTFREESVDPANDYIELTLPEATALVRQSAGIYTYGSGDDERRIELRADGSASYQEFESGRVLAQQRDGTAVPALRRTDRLPVLRVAGLGPIEIRSADSVVFARDAYRRVAETAAPAAR